MEEKVEKCLVHFPYQDVEIFLNRTPKNMLKEIMLCSKETLKSYSFVILGQNGHTGKTWFCTALKDVGLNAIELSNSFINSFISYTYKHDNALLVNKKENLIIIILNKKIKVGE